MVLKDTPGFSLSNLSITPLEVTALTKSIVGRPTSHIVLNNTSKIAITIDAPKPGWLLIISQKDAGTAGHTVTLSAGTFNGSNAIATLNAANECLVLYGLSATRFAVVENIGEVAFSG